MRARALFACTVGMLLLAIAIPAAAKPPIAQAHISGPGLREGGLRISGRAAEGMLASGIDLFGHLDDAMAGSIAELGLAASELGPRYVVSYRFDVGPSRPPEIVRQELYPYAEGGPVTYTPPDQRLVGPARMRVTAGWYRSSPEFFDYLVDQGLPEINPVDADREAAPGTVPTAEPTPWAPGSHWRSQGYCPCQRRLRGCGVAQCFGQRLIIEAQIRLMFAPWLAIDRRGCPRCARQVERHAG